MVAAGWEPAKNEFFEKCNRNINSYLTSCYSTVGVSIKTASYSNDYGDHLTITIWDINNCERFRFIYPTFFRGAVACLLFYDISIPQSFKQLNYWIEHIRSIAGTIPIFIIALKSHIKEIIDFEQINDFIEANNIIGFYPISIRKVFRASLTFDKIATRIFEYIGNYRVEKKKISSEEKCIYEKFILTFSRCPICLAKNHKSNLDRVFFSNDSLIKKLKENLIFLMKSSEKFEENYLNKIKIGIPCCSCHNKIFS